MPEWKKEIKNLAKDFYISQVKVNRILKKIEQECSRRQIPSFYKGNRDEFLYDNAQREIMSILYA